jgi:hypothetical protein
MEHICTVCSEDNGAYMQGRKVEEHTVHAAKEDKGAYCTCSEER